MMVPERGAHWGGNIPTMTSRVRQVAPIRKEAPLELANKAPQNFPQVPAGAGHHKRSNTESQCVMGAQGRDDGKVGLRRVVDSSGGYRRSKEELVVSHGCGGLEVAVAAPSTITPSRFERTDRHALGLAHIGLQVVSKFCIGGAS